MEEIAMYNEAIIRRILKQVDVNYDDYKDDEWALLDIVVEKWDEIGKLEDTE